MQLFRDFLDAQLSGRQKELGPLDPCGLDILVHCGARFLLEFPGEIVLGVARLFGQLLNGDIVLRVELNVVTAGPDLARHIQIGAALVDRSMKSAYIVELYAAMCSMEEQSSTL